MDLEEAIRTAEADTGDEQRRIAAWLRELRELRARTPDPCMVSSPSWIGLGWEVLKLKLRGRP